MRTRYLLKSWSATANLTEAFNNQLPLSSKDAGTSLVSANAFNPLYRRVSDSIENTMFRVRFNVFYAGYRGSALFLRFQQSVVSEVLSLVQYTCNVFGLINPSLRIFLRNGLLLLRFHGSIASGFQTRNSIVTCIPLLTPFVTSAGNTTRNELVPD
jgi:hypothetical protein